MAAGVMSVDSRPSEQPAGARPAGAIRADGVSLTFSAAPETVHALSDIHLSIPKGSFTSLIGAIVTEFFGTPIVGMGFRISTEVARMNLDLVWAEIVRASLTGTLVFAALSLLERRIAFWHPSFR
jgi:hypothetical protein